MDDLLRALGAAPVELATVLVAAVAIYVWVIAVTRLAGLRSLATMSAFDFAMTVAIGSIIASTALGSVPLASGLLAIALLYLAQVTVSLLRRATSIERVVDNTPLLLMRDGEVIDDHLATARMTEADLRSRLRGANVLRPEQVHAVVLETTGDVSVLHGDAPLDPRMLEGVRG